MSNKKNIIDDFYDEEDIYEFLENIKIDEEELTLYDLKNLTSNLEVLDNEDEEIDINTLSIVYKGSEIREKRENIKFLILAISLATLIGFIFYRLNIFLAMVLMLILTIALGIFIFRKNFYGLRGVDDYE